jgi:hypothetical protein
MPIIYPTALKSDQQVLKNDVSYILTDLILLWASVGVIAEEYQK